MTAGYRRFIHLPKIFVIDRGFIFTQGPYLFPSSCELVIANGLGSLLHKPCTSPKFRNPAISFHSMAPFTHPTLAALAPPHHSAWLLLLGHTLPRSTIPVTATSRPLYTAVMATAPLWSRPSARAGTGHVATTFSCLGETAYPLGSRNGTGLTATHPPRIWSLSPSDSLGRPVTVRGHARLKPTWFPLKSSLSRPQWR